MHRQIRVLKFKSPSDLGGCGRQEEPGFDDGKDVNQYVNTTLTETLSARIGRTTRHVDSAGLKEVMSVGITAQKRCSSFSGLEYRRRLSPCAGLFCAAHCCPLCRPVGVGKAEGLNHALTYLPRHCHVLAQAIVSRQSSKLLSACELLRRTGLASRSSEAP
jgi:hypothetical protein